MLAAEVSLFRILKLDVLIHTTNASGLSAFNPYERSMAPLSHDLAGLILPHDTFGTHLDSKGNTTDLDLEKKSFEAAGQALSEVWSKTVINDFKVDCKNMPIGCQFEPEEPDLDFVSRHALQTRYGLQVVKCLNPNCCEPFKTNWMSIVKSQFLPSPAVYEFGSNGLKAVEPSECIKNLRQYTFAILKERLFSNLLPSEVEQFIRPPYDLYCPSMQDKLEIYICSTCGKYLPSEAAKKRHEKCHKKGKEGQKVESVEHFSPSYEVTDEFCQIQDDGHPSNYDRIQVVGNIKEFIASPFEVITRDIEDSPMFLCSKMFILGLGFYF